MSGRSDPDDIAAFYLDRGARHVVFTMGAEGCYVAGPEGHARIPAFNVPVSDTTGCGDAFSAGFHRRAEPGLGHGNLRPVRPGGRRPGRHRPGQRRRHRQFRGHPGKDEDLEHTPRLNRRGRRRSREQAPGPSGVSGASRHGRDIAGTGHHLPRFTPGAPQNGQRREAHGPDRTKPPGFPGGSGWWARLGLNQRPLRCQRSALPAELRALSGIQGPRKPPFLRGRTATGSAGGTGVVHGTDARFSTVARLVQALAARSPPPWAVVVSLRPARGPRD